jgi:hypothetical protein
MKASAFGRKSKPVTSKLSDEWNDIVSKMSLLLKSYTSKFDHISEITLTWVRPGPVNAPPVEADTLTVEELVEHGPTRSSGYSVKIVGIGSTEQEVKSDGQMGFAVPKARRRNSELEQRPVD